MSDNPEIGSTAVLADFMHDWSAAEAESLAKLFSEDADLITPEGIVSRGQREIKAFYAAAFLRGYEGSSGTAQIEHVRQIAPGLILVDAKWSIKGAHKLGGSPRKPEHRVLVGLMGFRTGAWRILGIRESASATEFIPLAAAAH